LYIVKARIAVDKYQGNQICKDYSVIEPVNSVNEPKQYPNSKQYMLSQLVVERRENEK
jgi:hypothetical protein